MPLPVETPAPVKMRMLSAVFSSSTRLFSSEEFIERNRAPRDIQYRWHSAA
jgi:hypothetical protein